MSANMKVTGLSEMVARAQKMGKQGERAENEALKSGAEVLKNTMARNAPGPSHKQRVHLRDNIQTTRVKRKQGEKVVEVGPGKDAFYAHFLEFGTTKMTPRPFVEPSVSDAGDEVLRAITAELKRGLNL